jgi:hypothetical protein
MERERENAYRFVLAAGTLHLKWDLACLYGGFSWFRPFRLWYQVRAAYRAAWRAAAFHNLAIFSTKNFAGFSEEHFWDEIQQFQSRFPGRDWADYRSMFDRVLTGEVIAVIAPNAKPLSIPPVD